MREGKKQIAARFDLPDWFRLVDYARRENISIGFAIRRLVRFALDSQPAMNKKEAA